MGNDPTTQLALLRLSGEIGIKASATRRHFTKQLQRNLRDALASESTSGSVRRAHDRFFAEFPRDGAEETAAALSRVFGLRSLSLVHACPYSTLEEVVAAGRELFVERVRGRRFAVRARRVGDRSRICVSASDVARELGAVLAPESAGVDLDQPEVTVHVEIMQSEAYFFPERIEASGGLPLGTAGRAVSLLSGGFDSAVAAWQMQKRGVRLDYVFCNLGGRAHEQGVLRVAQWLADQWSYGDRPRLHSVAFEPVAEELRKHTTPRYWQLLLKRQMLRTAERIASERGTIAVVTGDAVGQVSSQTLQNLAVVGRATNLPILRPLVGFDKDEIIAMAQHIGSFELSKVVGEYCQMVQSKPATAAREEAIQREEQPLDPALLDRVVAERKVFDLRALEETDLSIPDLEVDQIPAVATLLDVRTRSEYQSWHPEGAVHLELQDALRAFPSFDRDKKYVVYCAIGLKSAHLAEQMRSAGLDAYHLRGGIRTMARARNRRPIER